MQRSEQWHRFTAASSGKGKDQRKSRVVMGFSLGQTAGTSKGREVVVNKKSQHSGSVKL